MHWGQALSSPSGDNRVYYRALVHASTPSSFPESWLPYTLRVVCVCVSARQPGERSIVTGGPVTTPSGCYGLGKPLCNLAAAKTQRKQVDS